MKGVIVKQVHNGNDVDSLHLSIPLGTFLDWEHRTSSTAGPSDMVHAYADVNYNV